MDTIKYIKLENEDGTYTDNIPLAVDAEQVNVGNDTLTNKLNVLNTRIDSLAHLDEGSTTGDAELIDGRIDNNGVIYNNIGANIRNIGSNLSEINGKKYLIPELYGWIFTSANEPPTVDNVYKAYGHTSIELKKGDMIKFIGTGIKFKYIYKDNENTYTAYNTFQTKDFLIPKDGLYYLTYSFTPEYNNVTNRLNELGSHFEIILNSDSLIGKYNNHQNKIANAITGLDYTGREMLLNILNKIVFTEDMSINIKNFINHIASKTDLIIDIENKRIANAQGAIWTLDGYCITKIYSWKEPINSITFYFECDETGLASSHMMQLFNSEGEAINYFTLNVANRANKEFTMTNINENYYGLRTTLRSAFRDNDYIYKTNTGEIIFAGKNSKYANKSNIYE